MNMVNLKQYREFFNNIHKNIVLNPSSSDAAADALV